MRRPRRRNNSSTLRVFASGYRTCYRRFNRLLIDNDLTKETIARTSSQEEYQIAVSAAA